MAAIEYVPDLYKKYIGKTADVIFDIGSRDGIDAKMLSDSLFAKEVWIFEAHPVCYDLIKKNYPLFNTINIAVSNYNGSAEFNAIYDNILEAGLSSLRNRSDDYYHVRDTKKIKVDVDTMENLINKHHINTSIDLVKIDVEGCSYEVLEGFGNYLKNVKMFHLETENLQFWENQKLSQDVFQFMENNGFIRISPEYFNEHDRDSVWIKGDI